MIIALIVRFYYLGTIQDEDVLLDFAKFGVYCQFDLFGVECSLYQLNLHMDMPSDAQRMQKVLCLVNEGHEDRILMSHDIHTKHRLVSQNNFWNLIIINQQINLIFI